MKHLILLTSLFLLFSCNSSGGADNYTINGKIEQAAGKKITLERLSLQTIVLVDSTTASSDGTFKMTNKADKGFYRLKVDNMFWILLLENAAYKFSGNMTNPLQYTFTGTPGAEEMVKAVNYNSEKQQQLQRLNEEFYARQNSGQPMDSLKLFAEGIQRTGEEFENTLKTKFKSAKDPMVALYYTSFLPINKYPNENLEMIKRMEKEMPKSTYTSEIKAVYDQMQQQAKQMEEEKKLAAATAEGGLAPDLEFTDPNGKLIKLSSLRGKVVLLDFWASWCGPCRREIPSVVAAYNKFKDKGFDIYSVSLDQDKAKWISAIAQDGLVWKSHVSDLKGWQSQAAAKYGVQGIPAQFLLDKDGKIIAKNLRGEELSRRLAEVLK